MFTCTTGDTVGLNDLCDGEADCSNGILLCVKVSIDLEWLTLSLEGKIRERERASKDLHRLNKMD